MKTSGLFPRLFITAILTISLLSSSPFCWSQAPSAPSTTVEAQAQELARLRQENATLRSENARLRQLLVNGQLAAPVYPAPSLPQRTVPATPTALSASPNAVPNAGLTHWMTTSSQKRHNSNCRYYKASNGRACRADEGIACKICGG